MRDLLGNVITEGSLVWWLSKSVPLKVTHITPGGLSTGRGKEVTAGRITLEISIPVQPTDDGSESQFTDFLCTLNPDAEEIISKMLEGQRKQ